MPKQWTEPDRVLVQIVAEMAPGQVLDVGCGGGHDTLWLARRGWSVTAIDLSRHAISSLRKVAQEEGLEVTTVTGDITSVSLEQTFDLISICYMHLSGPDRVAMLRNTCRHLKEDGTLLFRSFEASIPEAPFDPELLPSRDAVVEELSNELRIDQADVAVEFFPYMNQDMTLLTVRASRAR